MITLKEIYNWIVLEPSKPKPIKRNIFSLEDTQIMCNMWRSWKEEPKLYPTQEAFVKHVNEVLGVKKVRSTIIRNIQRNL